MLSITMSAPARILLVEGGVADESATLKAIEALGYSTDVVANDTSAVLARPIEHYGMILVDCRGPLSSDCGIAREIRRLEIGRSRIPIVVMTADAAPELAKECEQAGVDELLTCPIDPVLLKTCLDKWLDADTAPIDWNALLDGLDGDEDFVRQLIILFVEDGRNSLQQIAAAVKAGDYVALGAKAHGLKGSTANLMAEKARYAAERLEYAARESKADQIPQLAIEVQYELQRAMDYLNGRIQ
jgi:CheY-like chemotaxis protein